MCQRRTSLSERENPLSRHPLRFDDTQSLQTPDGINRPLDLGCKPAN
jgi:hypothetical protein